MKKLGLGVAAAAMVAFAGVAVAQNAKTGAANGDLTLVTTSSWAPTSLSLDVRVPQQEGLVFFVTLQCGLFTRTNVKSKGGNKGTETAAARMDVRVDIDQLGGHGFGHVAYAQPNGIGGLTFCSRVQTMSAVFQGLLTDADGNVCLTADPDSGAITIDPDCLRYEEVELILNTLNANAFNFTHNWLESGDYTVTVEIQLQCANDNETEWRDCAAGDSSTDSEAVAVAGMGSLIVDEVRFGAVP